MKKQYIAPASTSICYLEVLQPLCGSTGEEATHAKKTDVVWSNEKGWNSEDWSAEED
jgi:hypothetical protein